MLLGRTSELEHMGKVLDRARAGGGQALLLRGEAGIGKTTLLDAARGRAEGFTVLEARGVESESSLPFVALRDLLAPLAGHLEALPPPQAAALAGALALGPPAPGDRLAVCVAALGVLEAAARGGSVLVLVDDLQWVDPPSLECVGYLARRPPSGVALLLAERTLAGEMPRRSSLAAVEVGPLREEEAVALLGQEAPDLDEAVRDAVAVAAAGNPLALVELPASLSAAQRSGTAPLERPLPPGEAMEGVYAERLAGLPAAAVRALVVAAACESDALTPIVTACEELGVGRESLEPLEAAGLIELGEGRLMFVHPLVRGAAYHGADPQVRRQVHAALASRVDGEARAWHLAGAALGPDEAAAAALEEVAAVAGARRAHAAAADALERAAALTEEPDAAAARLVAAGGQAIAAARGEQAAAVLEQAAARATDPAVRAQADHLAGMLALWGGGRVPEAVDLLEAAADRAAETSPVKAALMLADAAVGCTIGADCHRALALSRRAADLLGDTPDPEARAPVLAILAWSLVLRGETPSAKPIMAEVERLAPLVDRSSPAAQSLVLALNVRLPFEDFEQTCEDSLGMAAAAREAGEVFALPILLAVAGDAAYRLGRWEELDDLCAEAIGVGEETGQVFAAGHAAAVGARFAAACGREDDCRTAAADVLAVADATGYGSGRTFARAALGFLELGAGRIDAAIAELEEVERLAEATGLAEPSLIPWAPDLVEAYARAGRPGDAARVLATLAEEAGRVGTSWAAAATARCRGLLDAEGWEERFAEAAELHERVPLPFERARTRLAWGGRLHRERRRAEAREHLHAALDTFEELGAVPWAERAAEELGAAGGRRRQGSADDLTPAELRVARAAAAGARTREIAAELYLSPKTVEFHLGRIYRKLGVRTRTSLQSALADHEASQRPG